MNKELENQIRELLKSRQNYLRTPTDFLMFARDACQLGVDAAIDEMAKNMDTRIMSAWNKSAELEREACAKLAGEVGWRPNTLADAIRARGAK